MGAQTALQVTYLNGAYDTFIIGGGPGHAEVWSVGVRAGVPMLIIGRGVPRTEIPLLNVRGWQLIPLDTGIPECGAKHPDLDVHCHLPHEHDGPEHCTSERMDADGIVWPVNS